jgi:hypothetical protein
MGRRSKLFLFASPNPPKQRLKAGGNMILSYRQQIKLSMAIYSGYPGCHQNCRRSENLYYARFINHLRMYTAFRQTLIYILLTPPLVSK